MKRGLTLVEMLVALVCTLLLMLAYTQLFGNVASKINDARSVIEVSNRMRSAAAKLRFDLQGITAETIPPLRPESGMGYFELIEGPKSDSNHGWPDDPGTTDYVESNFPLGDTDDVLMFTVRSKDGPFTGLFNGSPVQSEVAEVGWFIGQTPTSTVNGVPLYTLYRRVLLLLPNQSFPTPFSYDTYDVSVRREGANYIPNTLGDLTKRESRYLHGATFPHEVNLPNLVPFTGNRLGQDVVLTNVIGFDVQIWDATAPVNVASGVAVGPGDPGFPGVSATVPESTGSYVDLGWQGISWNGGPVFAPWDSSLPRSPFFSTGHSKSMLHTQGYRTYDTYSLHYEHDGLPAGSTDQGTDGFDNDGANGVDDAGERETMPPYPSPLRGIKIRIRCYEPDSRQVRELSVLHSFVPE